MLFNHLKSVHSILNKYNDTTLICVGVSNMDELIDIINSDVKIDIIKVDTMNTYPNIMNTKYIQSLRNINNIYIEITLGSYMKHMNNNMNNNNNLKICNMISLMSMIIKHASINNIIISSGILNDNNTNNDTCMLNIESPHNLMCLGCVFGLNQTQMYNVLTDNVNIMINNAKIRYEYYKKCIKISHSDNMDQSKT